MLSGWQIALIVYGAIAVFGAPLFRLGMGTEVWLLFSVLHVGVFATGFLALSWIIGKAFGYAWVGIVLTIAVVGIFFWKPIGDIAVGPVSYAGSITQTGSYTIFIKQSFKSSIDENDRIVFELRSGDDVFEFDVTPSQFDKISAAAQSCMSEIELTFLPYTNKILSNQCSE